MKRISLLFILVVILTGCSYINSNGNNKKSTSINNQSQNRSEISLTPGRKKGQKDSQAEKEELTFIPQNDEIKQGLTVANDKALFAMQKFVEENQNMGFEDDVTILYSGETFGESPNLAGIFLIVNRTEESLENIKFTYTFGGVDKNLIFNQKNFHLTVERFGVLKPNTVMPMYFIVKPENEKALREIDINQVIEKIDSFDYDVANNNKFSRVII